MLIDMIPVLGYCTSPWRTVFEPSSRCLDWLCRSAIFSGHVGEWVFEKIVRIFLKPTFYYGSVCSAQIEKTLYDDFLTCLDWTFRVLATYCFCNKRPMYTRMYRLIRSSYFYTGGNNREQNVGAESDLRNLAIWMDDPTFRLAFARSPRRTSNPPDCRRQWKRQLLSTENAFQMDSRGNKCGIPGVVQLSGIVYYLCNDRYTEVLPASPMHFCISRYRDVGIQLLLLYWSVLYVDRPGKNFWTCESVSHAVKSNSCRERKEVVRSHGLWSLCGPLTKRCRLRPKRRERERRK